MDIGAGRASCPSDHPVGPVRPRQLPGAAWRAYSEVTGRAHPGGALPPPWAVTGVRFVMFGIVGGLTGVLYVAIYLVLREWTPPAAANFAALAAAAVFNVEAHRVWTFRTARVAQLGMHVRSALLFVVDYAVTTGAVLVLPAVFPDAGRTGELVTLLGANLVMTIVRFVGLDRWIFRR